MYMICKERFPWQCKGCGLFNQEFVFGCLATMEDDQILTVLFSSWTGKNAFLLQRQKQMRPLVLRFKTQTWVSDSSASRVSWWVQWTARLPQDISEHCVFLPAGSCCPRIWLLFIITLNGKSRSILDPQPLPKCPEMEESLKCSIGKTSLCCSSKLGETPSAVVELHGKYSPHLASSCRAVILYFKAELGKI